MWKEEKKEKIAVVDETFVFLPISKSPNLTFFTYTILDVVHMQSLVIKRFICVYNLVYSLNLYVRKRDSPIRGS